MNDGEGERSVRSADLKHVRESKPPAQVRGNACRRSAVREQHAPTDAAARLQHDPQRCRRAGGQRAGDHAAQAGDRIAGGGVERLRRDVEERERAVGVGETRTAQAAAAARRRTGQLHLDVWCGPAIAEYHRAVHLGGADEDHRQLRGVPFEQQFTLTAGAIQRHL